MSLEIERARGREAVQTAKNGLNPLTEFEQGVLVAVSILLSQHDAPVIAADVVSELGLARADCSALDDFDKKNLKKIQGERGGAIMLRGL